MATCPRCGRTVNYHTISEMRAFYHLEEEAAEVIAAMDAQDVLKF